MTLLDSSFLISYLDGEADFDAIDDALRWVTTAEYQSARSSRRAAELMSRLHETGT